MPAQSAPVTGLLARAAGGELVKSQQKHKDDKPPETNAGLPAGIEGGVARLVDLHFGVYKEGNNKGKPFFMGAGIVIEPAEHAGARTQIGPEPICATPAALGKRKTFDDHFSWMRGQLMLLNDNNLPDFGNGGKATPEQVDASICAFMQALVKAKPHFRFRTWKGQKTTSGPFKDREPRVQHEWLGSCVYDETSVNGQAGGVQDDTGGGSGAAFSEFGDLPSLVAAAMDDDADAQSRLRELAIAAGVPEDEVDAPSATWEDVGKMIEEAGAGQDAEGGSSEPEEWKPVKGVIVQYAPVNPKTKKAGKKVDCEVTAVDGKKETVALKNTEDKKTAYKDVPWSKLEHD